MAENSKTRWDKENRMKITLNLNKKSDADILTAVEGKAAQTEIKRLVRIGLESESQKK